MKMYTMDDFINDKLSVRVNENNMMEFLKMCEAKGLHWLSGSKATQKNYPAETIEYYNDGVFGGLSFTRHDQLDRLAGRTIVDFSQIINPHACQITIDYDGDTTTAKMIVNGKTVKTATAKRNPADKANWHIGAQLAFDRLWERKKKNEGQKKTGVFKPGDRVVCVGNVGNANTHGKHGTVLGLKEPLIAVEFDKYINGHECISLCLPKLVKTGHGWWCDCYSLLHE